MREAASKEDRDFMNGFYRIWLICVHTQESQIHPFSVWYKCWDCTSRRRCSLLVKCLRYERLTVWTNGSRFIHTWPHSLNFVIIFKLVVRRILGCTFYFIVLIYCSGIKFRIREFITYILISMGYVALLLIHIRKVLLLFY